MKFLYSFFVSIKLAVITLSLLALLTAIGTFVESKYDQEMANKLVYHSYWMSLVMLLLAINLIMVLVDRWPWKKRHIPFILAHFGILTLMLGFVFSGRLGVDGSLYFKEGETSSLISLPEMELKLYASYDGQNFSLLYDQPVEMFSIKPSEKKPFVVSSGKELFYIDKYYPYAVGQKNYKASLQGGSPALRFHLSGQRANVLEWIELELSDTSKSQSYGPATITLTKDSSYKAKNDKELVLLVKGEQLFYSLGKPQRKSQQNSQKKALKVGQGVATGWMDLEFRVLEFFPLAQTEFVFRAKKKPSDATVKALRVRHGEESVWLGQNSYIRFYKKDKMYALAYLNKTIPLDFELRLLDFKIENYQGTQKAKSYQSWVEIRDSTPKSVSQTDAGQQEASQQNPAQKIVISMNEPLKYKNWTFYQSSFLEPEEPDLAYTSILSANRDPGRALKYIGSALIVLGIVLLFYRRSLNRILKTRF